MQKIVLSSPSDASQRVDKFLKKFLPNAPLGAIYKMLRTGKIKVNGKKKDQTYKLEQGDEVIFWMTDAEIALLQKHQEDEKKGMNKYCLTEKDILYEDAVMLVVNKPANINVHPGDHKTKEVSLIESALDYLGGKHDSLTFRPALLHRIDRDTTGCIVIVKEKESLEFLLRELQEGKIEKIYHAIVLGSPRSPQGTMDERILRIENAKNEAKVRVDPDGQKAVTHYRVLKQQVIDAIKDITISLLECRIETGRTHQIRVHLLNHKCPILWDGTYGDKKINAYFYTHHHISRQMLHARTLLLTHPKTKKKLCIEAPYPKDFASMVEIICATPHEYPKG